jgi:gamma-glutamyltranspeptidase/glutathione hydrolase
MPRDRRRSATAATGGSAAVSAGSRLAADVATARLRAGGNAVDAVIAGSAAQCVVELPWCGVGGDAFVLVRPPDGDVVGFNGSGVAPSGVLAVAAADGRVPRFGPVSVAVPAIVDAWSQLHDRYGTASFAELLDPARRLADDGFVLDERLVRTLNDIPLIEGGAQLLPLLGDGRIAAGERFIQHDLAETLGVIADEGRDGFYRGALAKRIADHVADRGGALSVDDLAAHEGEWVDPLSVTYRGATVRSNGLVSSGVLMLVALRVLERLWPHGLPADDLVVTDALVRLKLLLFGSVSPLLGDPRHGAVPAVLTDGTVDRLVARLQERDAAVTMRPHSPAASDTTSMAVIAPDGSAACMIHSLFNEFGARELVPETGIVLNDRLANLLVPAAGATTDAAPNAVLPGRRPLHTLHAYVVEWSDSSFAIGATPGGRGQVQTNLQVLTRLIDRGERLRDAVDHPRWVHGMPRLSPDDDSLYLETGLAHLEPALVDRGHVVEVLGDSDSDRFGNCTVVARRGDEVEAVADHRRGGKVVAW